MTAAFGPVTWGAYSLLALVCAVGLAVTLAGEFRASGRLTAVGKLLAASSYFGAAWSLGAGSSAYGRYLLAGMACCWVGDLLLVSDRNRNLFLGGLAAFLAGHVAYLAAFIVRGISADAAWVAAIPMLVTALLVGRWLQPYLEPRMRLPVHAYIAAISAAGRCWRGRCCFSFPTSAWRGIVSSRRGWSTGPGACLRISPRRCCWPRLSSFDAEWHGR